MTKKIITISIDVEIYEIFKAKKYPFSKIINKLLNDYIKINLSPEELQKSIEEGTLQIQKIEDKKLAQGLALLTAPYLYNSAIENYKNLGFSQERIDNIIKITKEIKEGTYKEEE